MPLSAKEPYDTTLVVSYMIHFRQTGDFELCTAVKNTTNHVMYSKTPKRFTLRRIPYSSLYKNTIDQLVTKIHLIAMAPLPAAIRIAQTVGITASAFCSGGPGPFPLTRGQTGSLTLTKNPSQVASSASPSSRSRPGSLPRAPSW